MYVYVCKVRRWCKYESKMCGVKDWESWGWYYHYLKIITLEEIWTESLIASQQALIDRTPTLLVIQNKKYWLLHFILIYYQVYNWNILCRRVYLNSLSPGFYSVSLRLSDRWPQLSARHVSRLPRWFSFSRPRVLAVYRLANAQECPGDQGPSPWSSCMC